MKRFYILSLAIILAACFSEEKVDIGSGSTFIRYYNGGFNDEPVSITKTNDGGYIILANTTLNDGRFKIKLIKIDDKGNSQWTKTYPDFIAAGQSNPPLLSRRAYGLLALNDGTFVLAGEDFVGSKWQVLVMKVSADGSLIGDVKVYPSPNSVRGLAVAENNLPDSTDRFILLGSIYTDQSVITDDPVNMVVGGIKKSDLSPTWTRAYGSGESNLANKIFLDPNGNLFFGGTVTRDGNNKVRLVKTQQDFQNTDFDLAIGTPTYNQVGNDIANYGPGFAVVGRTNETVTGETDIMFQRLTEEGVVINTVTFPIKTVDGTEVPGNKTGNAICVANDGGLFIAGTVPSNEALNFGRGGADLYLIKIDDFGNPLWQKSIGSRNADQSIAVLQADDGGYVVLAATTLAGLRSIMLLKTDNKGNIQ